MEHNVFSQGRIGNNLFRKVAEIFHIEAAAAPESITRLEFQPHLIPDLAHRATREQAEGCRTAGHARYIAVKRLLQRASFFTIVSFPPERQGLKTIRRSH